MNKRILKIGLALIVLAVLTALIIYAAEKSMVRVLGYQITIYNNSSKPVVSIMGLYPGLAHIYYYNPSEHLKLYTNGSGTVMRFRLYGYEWVVCIPTHGILTVYIQTYPEETVVVNEVDVNAQYVTLYLLVLTGAVTFITTGIGMVGLVLVMLSMMPRLRSWWGILIRRIRHGKGTNTNNRVF